MNKKSAKNTFYEKVKLALLLFTPLAIALELMHSPPLAIFIVTAIAIVPLASFTGKATEELTAKAGAGMGSFLNASLGNAAELIIGIAALREGLHDIVKASLTGAIIGNVLLVTGLAFLFGGLRKEKQIFNRTAASISATLLLLSATGLLVPALFHFVTSGDTVAIENELSLEIAVVLFIAYLLSLVFSFKTHKHLYAGEKIDNTEKRQLWSVKKATAVLLASIGSIAILSEFLVNAIRSSAQTLGLNEIFVGIIIVAIIGNAAEHLAAVPLAIKDNLDASLGITLGGSQQIALFVGPLLLFISYLMGKPMDLLFTPFEVLAVIISVFAINFVANDGESNWIEGVLLLSVYFIFAIGFYFLK